MSQKGNARDGVLAPRHQIRFDPCARKGTGSRKEANIMPSMKRWTSAQIVTERIMRGLVVVANLAPE
jgi:hypothetical protein